MPMMPQWDDFTWDPETQQAVYSRDIGDEEHEALETVEVVYQPLTVTVDKSRYFADLVFWLRTQNQVAPMRRAA